MGEPTPRDDENPAGDTPMPAASGEAGESAPVSPGGSAAPVPPDDGEPPDHEPSDLFGPTPGAGHPSPAGSPAPWDESAFAAAGETAPIDRPGVGDQTEVWQDETTRLTPEDLARPANEPGGTVIMPPGDEAPAWSGRAEVPLPPGGLREPAPYQPGEPPPPRTWWTPILLGLLALGLVGIVVLAAFLINQNQRPAPKPTPTTTPVPQPTTAAPATTAASPTGPASPTLQPVQVPADLVGKTQDDAIAALDAVGLNYSLAFQVSDKPKGTVISTSPEPGKLVQANSVVKLVISLGGESPTPTATA